MTTSTNKHSKIETLVATAAGLFASFTHDIGYLKAFTPILLEFPLVDSVIGGIGCEKPTRQLCTEVVCSEYSDEQLSIMLLAGTSAIDGYEIKSDLKTILTNADDSVTYPAWFTLIKIKDRYIPAEIDYDHEKRTGNKLYVYDNEIRNAHDNNELKAIFYAA